MTTLAIDSATEQVARLFEALPRLVAEDGDLQRRGRFLTCDFEIGVGRLPLMVGIAAGTVASVTRGPFLLRPWAFAIRAEPETWLGFLAPMPVAGVHDVMALSKQGLARIEGDLHPFLSNLQYIKDVLAKPRTLTTKA
jgi:hypothetical protein